MRDDDTGSLPMALLLLLVGFGLSALLVPVVVDNTVATRTTSDRTRALHAAQAGIDVMLGRIRAAVDGDGAGVTSLLPGPELTGKAGADGGQRYRVTITYYAADDTVVAVAGVTNPRQPVKAVLVSTGVESATVDPRPGTAGTRTLQGTYRFRTSNENIPGGMIPINGDATAAATLCLATSSPNPAAGTPVTAERCTQGDPATRHFAYTRSLTLQLSDSDPAMCLQGAGDPTSAGYQHASLQQIVLQPCAEVTTPSSKTLIAQQWSLRNYGNFIGTTDGRTLDGFCLNVRQPGTPGSTIVLGTTSTHCQTVGYNDEQTFLPTPTVGAGFAGAMENWIGNGDPATSRQIVSVGPQQFGRCLDIAGGYPDPTRFDYMIAWPCKQAPDPTLTPYSQMWTLPTVDPVSKEGTGPIRTYANDPNRAAYFGNYYCLQSSGSASVSPFVVQCTAGAQTDPSLLWTVTSNTGTYATSYQIKENRATTGPDLCLSPTGPNPQPSELYQAAGYIGPPISKVVLRACDGTQWQKWNAPPDLAEPQLSDFVER